jgi:uncharacterized Tic20 family protein
MSQAIEPGSSPQRAEPSHDERTSAMLAHVLSIFTGFLGPSVIYFTKRRESRFVAFHAKQAMLWHLALFVAMFAGIALAMVSLVSGVFGPPLRTVPQGGHGSAGLGTLLLFSVVWLLVMGGWLLSMGYAVYLAMQASSGRWARYPIVGRLVARRVNSDPR